MMTDASVMLWGRRIGAVSWDAARGLGVFQYDPQFAAAGIEVSPIAMPVREAPYTFPALGVDAFKGLPGLLADALPDRYGNALIDVWLAETGRTAEDFNPVDTRTSRVMQTIRTLGLGMSAVEEQFRRTVFNIVARNQDDHVKNIAFLMDRRGVWRLSPAYDVAYAHNPAGTWTREHQMSVAGKRDGFERADLDRFADSSGLRKTVARRVVDEVVATVASWPEVRCRSGRGRTRGQAGGTSAPRSVALTVENVDRPRLGSAGTRSP